MRAAKRLTRSRAAIRATRSWPGALCRGKGRGWRGFNTEWGGEKQVMSNLCPDFVRSKGRCGPQTLLRAPHPSSAPVRGGKGAQRGQDGGSPRCSLRGWVASAPLLPPSSSSKADVGCDTPAPSSPKPSSPLQTSPRSPPGRYLQAPPHPPSQALPSNAAPGSWSLVELLF